MSDHSIISTENMKTIARSDDRQRLQELLDKGLDLERTDEFLVTPLAVAAREGAVACVGLLIERGAALDSGAPPPAHAAIKAGRVDILEMLLKAGAESGDLEEMYDPDYPTALVVAAEEGNVPAIEALLTANNLARSTWASIDDALWHGLELKGKKKLAVLRALTLGVHESDIEVPSDASTLLRALKPLARAAKKNEDTALETVVRELKDRLNLAKAEQGEAEETFLESRFEDLFKLIERVPEVRRPGVLGVVAASAGGGCYYFSQWLLEKGAAAYLCDEKGTTALMHAAAHGSHHLLDPLLYTGQACLNAMNDAGQTAGDLFALRSPYRFAHVIERELTHLLNVRRDQGTIPLRISDAPSVTLRAWNLMRDRQIPELLALLKEDGLGGEDWRLAAGAAVLADSANDCMTLLEYCLDQGADPNAQLDSESNVLHDACSVAHIRVSLLRRLVEAGADLANANYAGTSVADRVRLTWPEDHECRVYMESVIAEAAGVTPEPPKQVVSPPKESGDGPLREEVAELEASVAEIKAEHTEVEDAHLESRFDDLFELIERAPATQRPGMLGVVAAMSTTGCFCFSGRLLEKRAAANLCDESGKTALMHIAAHGPAELAPPLLDTWQACLSATDDSSKTALDLCRSRPKHLVPGFGPLPASDSIEEHLTNPYFTQRDQGTQPLRISEAPRVAQRAWSLMRDRRIPDLLELLREDGLSQADWQLAAGAAVLADSANDCMTLLEYCLDEGADTNCPSSGDNVLHGACCVEFISLDLLRRIVDTGADPMAVTQYGGSVAYRIRRTWPEDHECRVYMESVIAEAAAKSS